MRKLFLLIVGVTLWPVSVRAGDKILDDEPRFSGKKSNPVTYQVDFSAVVTPPYKCKVLKIWMPIPPFDEAQEVSQSKFSTFPMKVAAKIGREKFYDNEFAYFEFHEPEGAQVVRHQFTIKTWEINWHVDLDNVGNVRPWPARFDKYLRAERFVAIDDKVKGIAAGIVKDRTNPGKDLVRLMDWVNQNMSYSHGECSLQGSAAHALEKKVGHCSDYHALCTALSRSLGYPARIAYGINPYPKNSPSHCKLEAFLPPYGWVTFDVSETQQLIGKIQADRKLDDIRKKTLIAAAHQRLATGFRDNTWYVQTRGSDYDLEPPAKSKVAVVRTIYAEADGVPYAEPDPANPELRAFSWMTVHDYTADRKVTNPFLDWKSLEK